MFFIIIIIISSGNVSRAGVAGGISLSVGGWCGVVLVPCVVVEGCFYMGSRLGLVVVVPFKVERRMRWVFLFFLSCFKSSWDHRMWGRLNLVEK